MNQTSLLVALALSAVVVACGDDDANDEQHGGSAGAQSAGAGGTTGNSSGGSAGAGGDIAGASTASAGSAGVMDDTQRALNACNLMCNFTETVWCEFGEQERCVKECRSFALLSECRAEYVAETECIVQKFGKEDVRCDAELGVTMIVNWKKCQSEHDAYYSCSRR